MKFRELEPPEEYALDEKSNYFLQMRRARYDHQGLAVAVVEVWNETKRAGGTVVLDDDNSRESFVSRINRENYYSREKLLRGLMAFSESVRTRLKEYEIITSGEDGASVEIFSAAALMEKELGEPKWAVEGLLQEGVTILAGAPKLGKSWLALNIGIAVASGGYCLGTLQAEYGDVLYLALEDGQRRLQGRLHKLLHGKPAPPSLNLATDWPKLDAGGLDAIDDWIVSNPTCRLVIIDTLKRVRPADKNYQNAYSADYDFIQPLAKIGIARGISIMVVHHTNKMASDDPLHMISGSLGLSGAADALFVLTRPRGQQTGTLFVTGRDVDEKQLALKWDAEIASWILLGEAGEQKKSDERREIIELIDGAMQPLTPKGVATILGKKYENIKVLMWKMARGGELEVDSRGRYSLPDNPGYPGYPNTEADENKEDAWVTGRVTNDAAGNRVTGSNRAGYPAGYPAKPNDDSELDGKVTRVTIDEEF